VTAPYLVEDHQSHKGKESFNPIRIQMKIQITTEI